MLTELFGLVLLVVFALFMFASASKSDAKAAGSGHDKKTAATATATSGAGARKVALLIIDVQNDFLPPNGSLAVKDGTLLVVSGGPHHMSWSHLISHFCSVISHVCDR
jgi:hypothetical protein